MLNALLELGLFASKSLIILFIILAILIVFFMLLAKGKEKIKGRLTVKNLNEKYKENKETLLLETVDAAAYKKILKDKKKAEKAAKKAKTQPESKKIYVLNFQGDMKASAVSALREEITTILSVATPNDEIILRLESPGGMVHGYGLAAAQLMRIRARNIPLTVTIDRVAASGGYMMACIANKILCSPFAIVGSIGVIVQLPNFHRLLKDKHIDFEQQTAGEFKRTLTIFGENTEEGRQKLQQEIEDIHQLFKNLIVEYRPKIDIQQVATGEHWLGQQALAFNLVDEIKTSDEYLFEKSTTGKLFEVCYEIKKPLSNRLFAGASVWIENLIRRF